MDLDTFGRARAAFIVDSSGNQISTFVPVSPLTSQLLSSAATTNATLVKSSAGTVTQISAYNASSSIRYLKLYDKATLPTVGTDAVRKTIPLLAGGLTIFDEPMSLAAGIGFAITANAAAADTTAIAAGDITCLNVDYI